MAKRGERKKDVNKRGQAALEFMMTYGWAILVVIIAISALAYFGVMKSDRFLPDSCLVGPGIGCLSHKATTDTLTVVLQNSLGQDILITNVAVTSCSYTTATTLKNGDKATLTFTSCSFGSSGTKLKTDLNVTYRDEEVVYHTRNGELITRVE
ncbi:MAG: hypothetical protein Q8O89_00805 [Nanoarchaeota archaeon]|nr:hypothetical protein [Nanoarchaeota archaeon]